MKTKIIYLATIIAFLSMGSVFSQTKTEKFKVYGSCGMCENRIEKAANSVNGVSSAEWDKSSKIITVKFDASKTSLDSIHNAIAAVGHDTEKAKAKDDVYNELPKCCHYREASK